jgi:hypothetical protein
LNKKYQPPAAIGSSSDGVTGGGTKLVYSFRAYAVSLVQNCRAPAAIGSSSDGVASGGKFLQSIH